MKKFLPLLILLTVFMASCASYTVITTKPQGAKVFVDDYYIGKTPVIYRDYKPALSSTAIKIEKEGYRTIYTYIQKDGSINLTSLVAGFFFMPAWIWALGYPPQYNFILQPGDSVEVQAPTNLPYTIPDSLSFGNKKAKALKELEDLHNQGLLTDEEYESKKKQILEEE